MRRCLAVLVGVMLLTVACTPDYSARAQDPVPPAQPPGDVADDGGDPPDWASCPGGFYGRYFNLPYDHPQVEPEEAFLPGVDPTTLDWWDDKYAAFEQFDPGLDLGANWWPVEQGGVDDPRYFSTKWTAWLRVEKKGDIEFVVGGTSDVWMLLDGEVVHAIEGSDTFEPELVTLNLNTGQMPLELRFAHRQGTSAFRFRLAGGDARICYPEFEDE